METVRISDLRRKAQTLNNYIAGGLYAAAGMAAESLLADVMAMEAEEAEKAPKNHVTESEVLDGGDCVCERCQQDKADIVDGLCVSCRQAAETVAECR